MWVSTDIYAIAEKKYAQRSVPHVKKLVIELDIQHPNPPARPARHSYRRLDRGAANLGLASTSQVNIHLHNKTTNVGLDVPSASSQQ